MRSPSRCCSLTALSRAAALIVGATAIVSTCAFFCVSSIVPASFSNVWYSAHLYRAPFISYACVLSIRYTPGLKLRSTRPSRSVDTRVVSPRGLMIHRSSCGSARTVRSLPTTAARSRTVIVVSTGGAAAALIFALSTAGMFGLHTCLRPSTSGCVPPARLMRVATSSVTMNVTQLVFARLNTRVLAT